MTVKNTLRFLLYHAEKTLQAARFPARGKFPALLSISFPKSGTHLLDQILLGFSKVAPYATRLHSFYAEYDGESGIKRPPQEAARWVNSLRARDIASAHLFARAEITRRVCGGDIIPYFIFRDPRDVVVSHVFYVTEMETRHAHHAYYQSLPDFNARLNASILGRPDAKIEFPDIAERFAPYLDWLNQPEALALRFEDLIQDRAATLTRIMNHARARGDFSAPPEKILAVLEESINPKKSPTFRSGKTGEWKQRFSAEHKAAFKRAAGDLLIQLGYEKNHDW